MIIKNPNFPPLRAGVPSRGGYEAPTVAINYPSRIAAGSNGSSVFGDLIVRDPRRPLFSPIVGQAARAGFTQPVIGTTTGGRLLAGNGASMFGDIIVNDPRRPWFKRMDPSPRHVNLTVANMSPWAAGPNGASSYGGLDFGSFRGFEGLFFGDEMVLPELDFTDTGFDTQPVDPNVTGGTVSTEPSFDWTKLFDPLAKLLGGVATGIIGAVAAGQRNPQTGLPYTQAQADAINRAQGGQSNNTVFGMSPLMIGGIAVVGIGAVLLFMNRSGGSAPALSGYGKRKRRRVKSRRR